MTENWAADVKKYVPDANKKAIAGIVKYCGIALQNRDSSLVSFTDKEEVARVRNNFLKKKLGLTSSGLPSTLESSRCSGEIGPIELMIFLNVRCVKEAPNEKFRGAVYGFWA